MVGTGRFELPNCGRERSRKAVEPGDRRRNPERGAARGGVEKISRPRPSQGFYSCASASLLRNDLGVLRGSADHGLRSWRL